MGEIQREIGVKQLGSTKFTGCGGPNERKSIKLIDFEIGLKKIQVLRKVKKNTG